MKFHVHYDQSVLDLDVAAEIQDVIAEVVDHVSKTLSVKQDPGFFLIPHECVEFNETVTIDGQSYCTVDSCYAAACGEILAPQSLSMHCFDCDDDGNNCIEFGGTTEEDSALTEPVHFTLFVGSTSSCVGSVLAYASACYIDTTTDRPVAGFMNICPIGLTLERERLLSLVQHEIFHALGFSPALYALYRDTDGNPLTPREANGFPAQDPDTGLFIWSDRVIRELDLEWDHVGGTTQRTVQAFVTPNIVREARAHFGCPTLMGLEIEDGGGFGTSLAHFERRIMATEGMNGFLVPVRVFSRMSLALMEDTGWYVPDYDQADSMNWGKDLGCDFVQKSCKYWVDTRMNAGQPIAPWCNTPFEATCHPEGVDVASCSFYYYENGVPPIFQIFTEVDIIDPEDVPYYGGDGLADYCPFPDSDVTAPRNQTVNDLYCNNAEIINDCRVSNCMNGGICRDVISGYYCDCPAGYAGALCDHVNVECTMNSDCQVNEVCTSNQCLCERDRIRDQNDLCIGVSEVKEYSMTLTLSEVNGQPAVYDPSLMGAAGESFRHGIEYEIRQIIQDDDSLSVALVKVVTRSISAGSIIVDLGLIFLQNSSDSSNNVTLASVVAATTTQENVLRESGTAYTINWNASGVQDANECEDAAGNECSQSAQCTNTEGSYECSCLPGFADTSQAGVSPGRNCTDINECSSNPCMNGANCTDLVNSYRCDCPSGFQGVDCETEDGCRSSPCQNGGTCSSLANRYLCECPAGYSGNRCQIAPVTCVNDNSCGDLQICNTNGMCECGPNYVENDNGQCEGAYFFEISLTITSLNGETITFSAQLYDVTSAEYIRLASILRRLLLLQVRILRRLARIFFRNGSVVAVFDGGVSDPMSANDLQQMIVSDLGNGNISSGGSSIGVDPSTLNAADVNECSNASDNDCSPNADCTNVEGSFTCRCRDGYTDQSPVAGRPGRVCNGGLSRGAIIGLSVGLGLAFILFLLLICTSCFFMQRRANLIYQEQYFRSPHHPRRHHSRHRSRGSRRDGGRNFKTVDRDFENPYGSYGASRPSPLAALYGDDHGKSNWVLGDSRGQMDSPFASRGPDYYMPPSRLNHTRPSRNQRPPRYSSSPVGHRQPSRHDYEEPLPPYTKRRMPDYDDDDEFNRPYYVSAEAFY